MSTAPSLIVVNYVLDDSDPFLSHQGQVVRQLSQHFSHIKVITGRVGSFSIPENVSVVDTKWIPGRRFRSLVRFIWVAIPEILFGRNQTIFSHMADLQAAVISPAARLAGKRHFLWYAHSHKSFYLTLASYFVNGIVTSTPGSCPISGRKVTCIGQSVDPKQFSPRNKAEAKNFRFIHVGRLDRSKNIELLINAVLEVKQDFPQASLTLVGSSANSESVDYFEELKAKFLTEIQNGAIRFIPRMRRNDLCYELWAHDYFIHAYKGSLDKTLIEATLTRMPVITVNSEYSKIFGSWSKLSDPTLVQEFFAMHSVTDEEIAKELQRRGKIAEDFHSTEHWIEKLSAILTSK